MAVDPITEMRTRWDERWDGGLQAEAATQLMRATQILESSLDSLVADFGLTMARYEALTLLSFSYQHEMALSKLGMRLMIHPASVTNIADRLASQGFIERLPHATDRRIVLARLTPEGLDVVNRASKAIIEAQNGLKGLTDKDLETLIRLCIKFRQGAGDIDSNGAIPASPEGATSSVGSTARKRTPRHKTSQPNVASRRT